VVEVDGRAIGDGRAPGAVTRLLSERYTEVARRDGVPIV
jgi:hypothetical protein